MDMSIIKDIKLATSGETKLSGVERNMPVLRSIGEDFKKTKPFAGLKVALSVHLEAKTASICSVVLKSHLLLLNTLISTKLCINTISCLTGVQLCM